MDPILALLDSAKEFDTVSLARSTEKALKIIMPWCLLQNSTVVAKDIHTQALVYAQAIDSSVEAANLGFAMAEDALSLIEWIPKSTLEQKIEYLEGLKSLTQKGYLKATEAKKGFINVRKTIENLLANMKIDNEEQLDCTETSHGFFNVVRRPFAEAKSELSQGIQDLEELSNMISKFVAWWNEMAMETNTQLQREEVVLKNCETRVQPNREEGVWRTFDKLHLLSIESKWKDHRKRYAAYVNEITIVQDRYPKLFDEAKLLDASPCPPPTYSPPVVLDNVNSQGALQRDKEVLEPEKVRTSSEAIRDIPGDQNQRRPTKSASAVVILSEELSSSSYFSASLASVQILEENKCLLILQFQCHPSPRHRFTSARIKWKFRAIRGAGKSPTLVDVAPKQSIGAKNEEAHQMKLGLKIPAQFNVAGVAVGPEIDTQWKMQKTLSKAMFFTGSIRGHGRDSAEWSIEENASAMSGIPPHFCVAVVVEYGGVFMMELDVVAKQSKTGSWFRSRNHAKEELAIDVDRLHHDFENYKPANNWQQWFPYITGEVVGGTNIYPQEAVCR